MLFAITLSAADITGTWKAALKTSDGTFKRTFVFKQDGAKLTGNTTSDRWGKSNIKNGKIDGDNITFTINIGMEFGDLDVSFTGKVEGDTIKMTAAAAGITMAFTARRTP